MKTPSRPCLDARSQARTEEWLNPSPTTPYAYDPAHPASQGGPRGMTRPPGNPKRSDESVHRARPRLDGGIVPARQWWVICHGT